MILIPTCWVHPTRRLITNMLPHRSSVQISRAFFSREKKGFQHPHPVGLGGIRSFSPVAVIPQVRSRFSQPQSLPGRLQAVVAPPRCLQPEILLRRRLEHDPRVPGGPLLGFNPFDSFGEVSFERAFVLCNSSAVVIFAS